MKQQSTNILLCHIKICSVLIVLILIIFFTNPTSIFAQTQNGSFDFEGQTRDYIVFLPQNYVSNMPVVFNLHGYGINANWQMNYTLMNDVADTAGFLVVYPNAVYPGFNSGSTNATIPLPNVNDVGFISALIDTMHALYNINMNRIYCCGYSNGAHMTYRLACQIGHRFAAIASVAGAMNDSILAVSDTVGSIPVLLCHGTLDQGVPYYGGTANLFSVEETLNFWVQKNNCTLQADTILLADIDTTDGCTVEKISYTNCSEENFIKFYKVIDGGHSWPSGAFSGSWSGNTNRDINASVEIWNFFKNHENTTFIQKSPGSTPNKFYLKQNYPNPFNPSTTIEFSIPKSEFVSLKIYNLLGQEVTTLVSDKLTMGNYKYTWDAIGFASGVYYYKIQSGEFQQVKKLILMK